MAWLQTDPSGNYHISFRFGGKKFKRSLKTTTDREAQAKKFRIEETITQPFKLVNRLIDGQTRSPFFDWLVMEVPTGGLPPTSLIAASRLRRGQIMCLLQMGVNNMENAWRGAVVHNDQLLPLSRIRLIGPEMPVIERSPQSITDYANGK